MRYPAAFSPAVRVLAASRFGFYQWLVAAPARAASAAHEAQLVGVIREVHAQTGGAYGAPRVSVELRERGNPVNHKQIERLMRRHGIVGAHLCRRKRTTIPDPATPPAPDLIGRDFTATMSTPAGAATSPTCRSQAGGCTWPRSSISPHAA